MPREDLLATAVVELARTLIEEFDILDFLQELTMRTAEIFGGSTAVLLLADQRGALQMVASSNPDLGGSKLASVAVGPAMQALRSGESVAHVTLGPVGTWPDVSGHAAELGLQHAQVAPLRLRDEELGALAVLLGAGQEPMHEGDLKVFEALAGLATVGLLQQRTPRRRELLAEQLQTALTLRIVLEQATGMVAELAGVSVGSAFSLLDGYARRSEQRLGAVAQAVIEGRLGADDLAAGSPRPRVE